MRDIALFVSETSGGWGGEGRGLWPRGVCVFACLDFEFRQWWICDNAVNAVMQFAILRCAVSVGCGCGCGCGVGEVVRAIETLKR